MTCDPAAPVSAAVTDCESIDHGFRARAGGDGDHGFVHIAIQDSDVRIPIPLLQSRLGSGKASVESNIRSERVELVVRPSGDPYLIPRTGYAYGVADSQERCVPGQAVMDRTGSVQVDI